MFIKINFRLEIILLIIILILLLFAPMILSCTNHSPYKLIDSFVEGFVEGMSNTLEQDKNAKISNTTIPIETPTTTTPTPTPTPTPIETTASQKKPNPIPLEFTNKKDTTATEGFTNYKKYKSEIPLIFDNTKFSPKCCPNPYSNSIGCACITMPQYRFLIERGGNNVPFTQY
jgi:hypothetical protein